MPGNPALRLYEIFIPFSFNPVNVTASCYCLEGKAQVTNPCAVVAGISPASADPAVPLYTFVPFTSTSINATSYKWLYDGMFNGITGTLYNYSVTTGIHTISLVAFNGNCSDTTTVVYFCAGTPHDVDSLLVAVELNGRRQTLYRYFF